MNVNDCWDVAFERACAENRKVEERERQIFLNKCLRQIKGEDAYEFLVHKAAKILGHGGEPNIGVYAIVNYYFDNEEYFDCSFEDWLKADNGPLVRYGLKGLFPELEFVTDSQREIAKLAKEKYGVELTSNWEGKYFWSFEFNFKEINSKRVDLDKIKEELKNKILEEL